MLFIAPLTFLRRNSFIVRYTLMSNVYVKRFFKENLFLPSPIYPIVLFCKINPILQKLEKYPHNSEKNKSSIKAP